MRTLTYFTYLFFSLFFISCESQSLSANLENTITLGSNFGFCFGPCFQTMTIEQNSNKAIFTVKYRTGADLETESFEEKLSDETLSTLINEIDYELIYSLKETYGCPDCADGGSEWIEVNPSSNSSEVKRVTFEYGNPPKEIENLVNLLRSKKEILSSKYVRIED